MASILDELAGGALRNEYYRERTVAARWVVDFYFYAVRLAIEVDGPSHDTAKQQALDRIKDGDCVRSDITLLRVTNDEVFGDRDTLVQRLRQAWRMAERGKRCVIPGQPPAPGGGTGSRALPSHLMQHSQSRRFGFRLETIQRYVEWRSEEPTPAQTEMREILENLNGGVLKEKFSREAFVASDWPVDFFFPDINLAIVLTDRAAYCPPFRALEWRTDQECASVNVTVLAIDTQEVGGSREQLVARLRAGWRAARNGERRILRSPIEA